ncbi:MAG: serine hydrolase [Gemmatimonadetes bacterium]|nr:serine hydrolase [Gemmatimonadota bacterium]
MMLEAEHIPTTAAARRVARYIFFRATGVDIEEYAARHLFAPLRHHQLALEALDLKDHVDTEGGLYRSDRPGADLATWLQGGQWKERQMMSERWVRGSVTPPIATRTRAGAPVQYKWWLYSNPVGPDAFIWAGSGFGGQFPMAFPDQEMVVVFNAWNISGGPGFRCVLRYRNG